MNVKKLVLLAFSIALALTLMPLPVGALSYRADVDNGSWSQYTPNLSSEYYQPATTGQSTYNRNFESSFSLGSLGCASGWCWMSGSYADANIETSSTYAVDGTQSLKMSVAGGENMYAGQSSEYVGDSNVSFYFIGSASGGDIPRYGYFNDSNVFTTVSYSAHNPTFPFIFDSYLVPAGNNRIGFYFYSAAYPRTIYYDNIRVLRNNTGTFFKGMSAPNCGNVASCSNISSANDLNANAVIHVYWVIDYVPSALCTWSLNSVAQGSLTEMAGGMYYGEIDDDIAPSAYKDFNVSAYCSKVPFNSKGFFASPRIYLQTSNLSTTLTASNTLTSNTGVAGEIYYFYSDYKYLGTEITGATCTLTVDDTLQSMTYNGAKYAASYGFVTQGIHTVAHGCAKSLYADGNSSYSVSIGTGMPNSLIVTPLSNVSGATVSIFPVIATISLNNNFDDVVFSAESVIAGNDVVFEILNSDKSHVKQYEVYSSSDGSTWVFDETLTNGTGLSNYDSGLQKVWNVNEGRYDYSFSDTFGVETKYFKLVFANQAVVWETIKDSVDWLNVNSPTAFVETVGEKTWDLFNDSNYSPLQSYTRKNYPKLTTTDLNAGFYLQFTAYSTTDTNIQVGYRVGSTDTTNMVSITTTKTRYSVPITPASVDAQLLFKHNSGAANSAIYMTDYVVVPRAYFASALEVFNLDGSELAAVLRDGVSYEYLQEGVPFKIKTKGYDREGDLDLLRVEAMIGAVVIKTYSFSLTDATDQAKVFSWYETIDGIIDLNGTVNDPSTLRSVFIKATLVNSAGQSVAEQTRTVKLLQYPSYPSDFSLTLSSLNKKVGLNPKFRLVISQIFPASLLGFKIKIYDSDHTYAVPNFEDTIYSNDLACGAYCTKDILVDGFLWSEERVYTVAFVSMLSTQEEDAGNYLTTKYLQVPVTYTNFILEQIVQTYERNIYAAGVAGDGVYRNDEPIPLVVRLADSGFNDLSDNVEVYLRFATCSAQYDAGSCGDLQAAKFYSRKNTYDAVSGLNLFFFKDIFYMDDGSLLGDGNYVQVRAFVVDRSQSHSINDVNNITLADKCKSYPVSLNFFRGNLRDYSFSLPDINVSLDWNFNVGYHSSLFGCGITALGISGDSSPIITTDSAEQKRLLIDADYNVQGGQNQNLICYNTDWNNSGGRNRDMSAELDCLLLYTKGETSVDKFGIKLGNDFSRFSEQDPLMGQYLGFDILEDEIILNDPFAVKTALATEYGTSVDTVGEFTFAFLNTVCAPFANFLFKTKQSLGSLGVGGVASFLSGKDFFRNTNWDVNFEKKIDPTYINTAVFFKIRGFKVTNQEDFVKQYPELSEVPSDRLREYAKRNNIKISEPKTTIELYSTVNELIRKENLVSPMIISVSQNQQKTVTITDTNNNTSIIPITMPFRLISDMLYGNESYVSRIVLPFSVEYLVPAPPFNPLDAIACFLWGCDDNGDGVSGDAGAGESAGLLQDPPRFVLENWFPLFILVIFVLVVSVIYMNFAGGGKVNVNVGRR